MFTTNEVLATVPLFKGLDEEIVDRIARATRRQTFAPGEDIVQVGEPGRSLYVLTDGSVKVLYPARSMDFELARLGPGEFFGEMALLNDKPRSATVRAVGRVEALVLDKTDFRDLILESPELGLQVLEALSVRIRNADEQISGLSDKAVRDPLTGMLNRRAFNERLVEEIDRTRRYGDPFSMIMIDLDNFKAINDDFGHDVGDQILAWIGRMLGEHTRSADTPFRIGGEEFAVLAPSTSTAVAMTLAQRLVGLVAEAKPPIVKDLKVTMSASYSTCPDHGDRVEMLYRVADQGLYRAKDGGRNRVAAPEPLPAEEQQAAG